MKITIKAFASVKDILNFDEKKLNVPDGLSIENVIQNFSDDNESLKNMKDSLLYAVNENYCTLDTELCENDILAIFPPVSGG